MLPETVAIIPARGGSKRIPRKNIKAFLGKPILGHVIEILKDSQAFGEILVSTDDTEIKMIASDFGADSVIDRPEFLADDLTPTQPVIQHAIQERGLHDSLACCVYPCNPLLTKATITACLDQVRKSPGSRSRSSSTSMSVASMLRCEASSSPRVRRTGSRPAMSYWMP